MTVGGVGITAEGLGIRVMRSYFVYVLASGVNGTLYVGVTSNLLRRVDQHRRGVADGFTKKYGVHRLVYFERYGDIRDAIRREKRMKLWKRAWKVRLIEKENPEWRDLFEEVVESGRFV